MSAITRTSLNRSLQRRQSVRQRIQGDDLSCRSPPPEPLQTVALSDRSCVVPRNKLSPRGRCLIAHPGRPSIGRLATVGLRPHHPSWSFPFRGGSRLFSNTRQKHGPFASFWAEVVVGHFLGIVFALEEFMDPACIFDRHPGAGFPTCLKESWP